MSFLLNLFTSLPADFVQPALIDIIDDKTGRMVPCQDQSWSEKAKPRCLFPAFKDFVRKLVNVTKTLPSTLLTSMVYLDRLKLKLSRGAYGHKETAYRVFVASLIIATKFVQDGAMRNDNWGLYLRPWFGNQELNLMERQFLRCIDYDLYVTEEHLSELIMKDPRLYRAFDPLSSSLVLSASDALLFPGTITSAPTDNPLSFFTDDLNAGPFESIQSSAAANEALAQAYSAKNVFLASANGPSTFKQLPCLGSGNGFGGLPSDGFYLRTHPKHYPHNSDCWELFDPLGPPFCGPAIGAPVDWAAFWFPSVVLSATSAVLI